MELDPFQLIEGIILAAYIINANKSYIYIRGEYNQAIINIKNAISECYKNNVLGQNILGSKFSLEMEVSIGAGSYLCGEELTLIESLEGKRGYPRIKPPFPADKGLWQQPTLVNNVETFAHIPYIISEGYKKYSSIGTEESKGTKLYCVSGNVKKTGLYELPMGITLKELVFEVCEGMNDGFSFKGALLGGAAGTFVNLQMSEIPLAYETLKKHDSTLGSGSVIIIDDKTNIQDMMLSILSFFNHESCGKCVPCRVGTTVLLDLLKNNNIKSVLPKLIDEATYISKNSLCPLGQSPILSLKTVHRVL